MSNLIKGYAIAYNEQKKKEIDLNEKAEMFQKLFAEQIESAHQREAKQHMLLQQEGDVEFSPGIAAIPLEFQKEEFANPEDEIERLFEEKIKLEAESEQIIQDAKEKADAILKHAEIDANQKKKNILEAAKAEGYEAGRKLALAEEKKKNAELEAYKLQLQFDYNNQVKSIEPAMVELLISFLKKLTGYTMDVKKDLILYLVDQALQGEETSTSFLVRVSADDYTCVNEHKNEILLKIREGSQLEIISDKLLVKGQCFIETESRVIDSSIDVLLDHLIADLRLLSGVSAHEEFLGDKHV